MSDNAEWRGQMQSAVGPKGFTSSDEDMKPWLTDWRGRYTGHAAAMVSPANTRETSEIVRIANANSIAIVPQGGNSGMVGGATPDNSGRSIILSLRRMNQIRSIEPEDQLVLCEAGVILQNLHDALLTENQRFPLTLGGKGSATVGGLISTNAGGTQVLRHGTMRSLVAGIEAVLPDGSIFDGLAALKKDNRGYDLKQLFVGGEGTLGVVTAATLKTVPALVDRCVAWAGVDGTASAYELFRFLNKRTPQSLEGFEIVPNSCLDSVLRHIPGTRAPLAESHPWHVLIEVVRDQPDGPDPRLVIEKLLTEAMERQLIEDATLAASEQQAEDFWKIRDSIAEAERASGPALQHDISVPVPGMARFINEASSAIEARFAGTKVAAFGHMGDGNVHFHVKAPPGVQSQEWMHDFGTRITPVVHDLVIAAGGSISAEHGIGQNKRSELMRLSSDARLSMLRAIKIAIDPNNIMNPGKLVPLASDQSGS
ncbi:FAD-binding oxidoreductase [Parasphingorhabdus sp.]|uniref:FAD-binding oxidoreductase n=1 Tax=Parasphingorhabdus sp. TaxID=2709688 RepID=UPI00300171A7